MNTRTINLLFITTMCVLLASCSGSKKLAYLQTSKTSGEAVLEKGTSNGLFEARVKPKDLLIINVVTSEISASRNYNMLMPQVSDMNNNSLYGMPSVQTYLVDNDGNIGFSGNW